MSNVTKLRRYQCHNKQASAGKILFMAKDEQGGKLMLHLDSLANIVPVDLSYLQKHKPQIGGYYVVHEDGYESFSPAEVFESGYILLGNSKLAVATVSEEDLERLFWEFDAARSKSPENERLRFKETLRGLVRSLGHEVI